LLIWSKSKNGAVKASTTIRANWAPARFPIVFDMTKLARCFHSGRDAGRHQSLKDFPIGVAQLSFPSVRDSAPVAMRQMSDVPS
jgi:hypothetical protein